MGVQGDPFRAQRLLLLLATLGLLGSLVGGVGWYWIATTSTRVTPDTLSPEDRQALLQEIVEASPGIFAAAFFEPTIAYTLKRRQTVTAWGTTFRTNRLGYRASRPAKQPSTFRVVFVGDSWTFGMGVREGESFPKHFERIANERSGLDRRVEAWNLGMPGHNTFNELAAFWFWFQELQPDAVVICPTVNDNHSEATVLPNGSLTRQGVVKDSFGDDHSVVYQSRLVDSFKFRSRWQLSFDELRETEVRLQDLGIPLLIYFAGLWDEPFVHRLILDSGVESPYVITPPSLASEDWRNPLPIGHAKPEANRRYGRLVYQAVARLLGWKELDEEDVQVAPLYQGPPEPRYWIAESDILLAKVTRRWIPESFRPSDDAAPSCAGPMDPRTGLMGRATTVLVRRTSEAAGLKISVKRLPRAPSLYPLELTVWIPSAAGGTQTVTTVPASGPEVHSFQLEIPEDVKPGAALDVTFHAHRTISAPDVSAARSVFITSIEQIRQDRRR